MDKMHWQRLTASGQIADGAVLLGGIIATPDGTTKGYCDIHNGASASDPMVLRVRANVNQSRPVLLHAPILLDRGLYVHMDGVLESVAVIYASVTE